jgi:hypothetical protein
MAAKFGYSVVDEDGLLSALENASQLDYDKVVNKTLTEMRNRSMQNNGRLTHTNGEGGTPVDTGELRLSAMVTASKGTQGGEFGYIKDYAPHVEFGHRTRGGGYVPGQKFLYRNLELQTPILMSDTMAALKETI